MTTSTVSNFDQNQAIDLSNHLPRLQNDIHGNRPDDAGATPPLVDTWSLVFGSLDLFSADFMATRNQPEQQRREKHFP